jgi:hypothetical protein
MLGFGQTGQVAQCVDGLLGNLVPFEHTKLARRVYDWQAPCEAFKGN